MRHARLHPRLVRWAALTALWLLALAPARAEDRTLRLESIEVPGADAALLHGIGRLVDLHPGDAVDAARLRAARRTLIRSGWFEDVDLYTARGSRPGRLQLRVDGTLDRGLHLESGFGHDPLEGWTLDIVGVSVRHLFGSGSLARASWQLGPRQSMVVADVEVPYIAQSDWDLLVRFRAGGEQWNAYSDGYLYQQDIARASLHAGLRWNLTPRLDLTFWVGRLAAESVDLNAVDENAPVLTAPITGETDGQESYGDIAADLTYDDLDPQQPWRRGQWAQLRLQITGEERKDPFARAHVAYRGAAPLPGESALALRLDGKWSDRSTPYHLRPWFGGTGSVRGFREASLSGGFGARAWTAAALELRSPLFRRGDPDARVHGALFVDTGNWVGADGETGRWSTSVGWGLRVRVPWIERVSVDFAIPITPTATDDAFWAHAGLGFGF